MMQNDVQAPIIIIGSGLAGYNVAREFRKLNQDSELIIVADDAAEFYSKPLLSNALVKKKAAAELATATAEKMAADLNATILNHTRVIKIDSAQQQIHTSGNESYTYSQLVLALGASTIRLNVAGNASDKILSVNDLASYAAFREAINNKQRVAIIGAGLIGCEFANDLILSDYQVSVIGNTVLPLNQLLPASASEYLKNMLAEQGVDWHLGKSAQEINFENGIFQIIFDDGTQIETDVVLSAIGLAPNVTIAGQANLKINKGIVVNRHLETSAENIFALGDCAEVENLFLPYVMPLMNSARALAKSLNGDKTAVSYPAMPVMVKTPSCALVVAPPATGVDGDWIISRDAEGVHASYRDKEGNLHGFALLGKAVEDKQRLTKELPAVLV